MIPYDFHAFESRDCFAALAMTRYANVIAGNTPYHVIARNEVTKQSQTMEPSIGEIAASPAAPRNDIIGDGLAMT